MIALSEQTVVAFKRRMERVGVSVQERSDYLRWVRFYLDFCQKFGHPPREESSINPFLAKLESKKQPEAARWQASQAVHLLLRHGGRPTAAEQRTKETFHPERDLERARPEVAQKFSVSVLTERPPARRPPGRSETPRQVSPPNTTKDVHCPASWEREYQELKGVIKMRNYSGKTYEAYRIWVQKFQAFTRSKPTGDLETEDVKLFLTDLAVRREVAASTQNQAFNALLFFYRHVLCRELGKLEGVPRAKRRPYVPVVLSRGEVDALIAHIPPPYRLVALLLYGCGLRLTECLELRVHCFNLESRLLTIHDGKGQKDRTVCLPERVMPEIGEQMELVRETLRADLAASFAGTFLPRQLGKKYKNASREFIWQWFFPAATLTTVPELAEKRRFHLHASHVQATVKRAASDAGITKRVSPHTFRHTFASHLLMAGYDLPTIQKLLGHGDVKTTMIYVQTVPSQKLKEAKSPLDL